MIADAAAGRMPAYVDTGLNIVHVDDVAEGHALALERGVVGQRYILGGENLTMAALLALVDRVTGRPAAPGAPAGRRALAGRAGQRGGCPDHRRRAARRPRPSAHGAQDHVLSSAKAMAELGYLPRPARQAIADAIDWFRARDRMPPA